jgi:hypothetical protein
MTGSFTTGSWEPGTAGSCQDHGLALPRRPCRRRQVSWSSPHAKCRRHTLGLADLREGSALAPRPHPLPRPSDAPGRESRERGGREMEWGKGGAGGRGGQGGRGREGGRDRERREREGRGVKGVQHACVSTPHAHAHAHAHTRAHAHAHTHAHALREALPLHPLV